MHQRRRVVFCIRGIVSLVIHTRNHLSGVFVIRMVCCIAWFASFLVITWCPVYLSRCYGYALVTALSITYHLVSFTSGFTVYIL